MIVNTLIAMAALAIVYSLACRANLMDDRTHHDVRAAFTSQATSALAVTLFAFAKPDWLEMAMAWFVLSVLWVQWVTARHWSNGQPQVFRGK